MIEALIGWSLRNRALVLLATGFLVAAGVWAMRETPLDAVPDLSDVQVIVQTDFAEQAPQIVEDQVTYPITSEMLKVPGASTVRGYSFFGLSLVYVIFERFGEVVLAKPLDGQDRLHTPTAVVEPGPAAQALLDAYDLRVITLDDSFGGQNPTSVPHPGNGEPFSLTNTFRGGDTVTGVEGVIVPARWHGDRTLTESGALAR